MTSHQINYVGQSENPILGLTAPSHSVEPPTAKRIRVLRIAHASLTPSLRGRERGIAKTFPQVDLEVLTPPRWFESGVEVNTIQDDFFPVRTAKTFLSKHIQLFAYDPRELIKALKREEGKMMLCDMQDYVKEVFEIAGFDSFLPIVGSMDDALPSF